MYKNSSTPSNNTALWVENIWILAVEIIVPQRKYGISECHPLAIVEIVVVDFLPRMLLL